MTRSEKADNTIPHQWVDLLRPTLTEELESYFDKAFPRYEEDFATLRAAVPGGELLEIGSYPYCMTVILQESGYVVTGLDKKTSRGDKVIARFNLNVRECDIEESAFPFDSGSFDIVVLTEVIEHLRIDPLFTLCEINRCLRKGGKLFLTTPNLYGIKMVARYLSGRGIEDPMHAFGMLKSTGHMGHLRTYTRRNIHDMLAYAGFEVSSSRFRLIKTGSRNKIRRKQLVYSFIPKCLHDNIVVLARKRP